MKTLGSYLESARRKKKRTLIDLESEIKIKREFIRALEKHEWSKLPEYPVVTGFVKRISKALNIPEDQAVALLRRDYPPQVLSTSPQPDVLSKFSWSPRFTFLVGIVGALLIIVSYLLFQYSNFTSAPNLNIIFPNEGQVVNEYLLQVEGTTDPEATIRINNQPVLVDESGVFKTEIEIFEGTKEIYVKAESRSGKVTEISRTIIPKLTD